MILILFQTYDLSYSIGSLMSQYNHFIYRTYMLKLLWQNTHQIILYEILICEFSLLIHPKVKLISIESKMNDM